MLLALIPSEAIIAHAIQDIEEMGLIVKVCNINIFYILYILLPFCYFFFKDIDECSERIDNCHRTSNATCIDTIGSFECACTSGYTGNGTSCFGNATIKYFTIIFNVTLLYVTDIDECLNTSACVPNSMCANSVGSYDCICNEGFMLNNSFCSSESRYAIDFSNF